MYKVEDQKGFQERAHITHNPALFQLLFTLRFLPRHLSQSLQCPWFQKLPSLLCATLCRLEIDLYFWMLSPRRDALCLWLLANKAFYLIKIVLPWICRYLASNIYNHCIAGIFFPLHSKSELAFLINMVKIKGHILIFILVVLCKLSWLEFILGQIISKLKLDFLR